MYGFGYGFRTYKYYLICQLVDRGILATLRPYICNLLWDTLFQNLTVKQNIKLKIIYYFVLGQGQKNMNGLQKAWAAKVCI